MGLDFSKLRAEVNQIGADVQAIAERLRTADPADQAVIDDIVNQLDAHGKILEGFTLPEQPQPPADPSA